MDELDEKRNKSAKKIKQNYERIAWDQIKRKEQQAEMSKRKVTFAKTKQPRSEKQFFDTLAIAGSILTQQQEEGES